MVADLWGERRLKQKDVRPTMTVCVVAYFRRLRSDRRQRSALPIRRGSAWRRGRVDGFDRGRAAFSLATDGRRTRARSVSAVCQRRRGNRV